MAPSPSFLTATQRVVAQKLAEAILPRGWALLSCRSYLRSGGERDGGKYVFPGTYSIRRTTLRAIFMDLATELGEQGFRRIFVMHGHGGPFHNLSLDQAGDYFRDTYSGSMVNLHGLEPTAEQMAKLKLTRPNLKLSESQRKEIGTMDDHADLRKSVCYFCAGTSLILATVVATAAANDQLNCSG